MATIKKPGYQDPEILKQMQAGLDAQPGAQFIAQKLPQNVLDAIAARRAQSGKPPLKQATPAVQDVVEQPTTTPTQPQRYSGSEDLSPQPTQTDFASGLDERGLRQYNTYKELAKMKFPNANADLIENIAQMQTQPYLDALKPKTKLSAVEKFELTDMGVSEAELSAYERGEVPFSDIMKAAKEYKEGRKLELERTQEAKLAEARRLLDIEYAPRYTRAEQSAGVSKSTIGRTMAATGRGVSSINTQKLQEAENIYQEQLAAIDAQKQSAMMLREAQIRGATTEELDSLNAQYQRSREVLANAQAMSDQLQMEALQTAQQTGNTAMLELLETLAEDQQNKNNVDYSEDLTNRINDGFAYDKQGNRLVDSKGNALTVEEQNLNSQLKYRTTQLNPMGGYSVIFTDADNNPVFKRYDVKGNLEGVGMGTGEQMLQETTGASSGAYRTDRHRNPLGIIVPVAKQAGLQEGVDFTVGDPFYEKDEEGELTGKIYYTANILTPDPIQTMVDVLDRVGFSTQTGGNRFGYLNGPQADAEWQTLSNEEKKQAVERQYMQNEGGSGELLRSAMPEMTETQPTEQIQSTEYPVGSGQMNWTPEQQRQIEQIKQAEEDAPLVARQTKLDFDNTEFGKKIQQTPEFVKGMEKLVNFDLSTINNFAPGDQNKKIYDGLSTIVKFVVKEAANLGVPTGKDLELLESVVSSYSTADQFFAGPIESQKTALMQAANYTEIIAYNLRQLGSSEGEYQINVLDDQLAQIPRNSLKRRNLENAKQYIQSRLDLINKIDDASLVFLEKYGQLSTNTN